MIVVLSDTHGREDPRLEGRTAEAVRTAALVIHAGDFIREPVLDAFEDLAASFVGVSGNVDDDAIRRRLPEARTVTVEGFTLAVTHTVDGGSTALKLFGRERDADLVISGHSHRPEYTWTGDVGLLNPGSHAQPRGNRPGHAELTVVDGQLSGRLLTPDGDVFERFVLGGEGG